MQACVHHFTYSSFISACVVPVCKQDKTKEWDKAVGVSSETVGQMSSVQVIADNCRTGVNRG